MISRLKKQLDRNDKLLKHGILVLIAAIATGFVNYIYQVYMGRTLGPEQYGVLAALFSIVYMEMFSLGSLNTVISKMVAEFSAEKKFGEIKSLFYFISIRLLIMGMIVGGIMILFAGGIAGYFKLQDNSLIFLLAAVLVFIFPGPIVTGFLNGLQNFVWSGSIGLAGGLLKLAMGVLFVYMGFGVKGALIGLLLGTLIQLALVFVPLRKILRKPVKKINSLEIFRYTLPATIIMVSVTLIINLDVILVRHKFNALDAGIYASASTLAKIIWFASGPLITVMLPKVTQGNGRSILRDTLIYVFAISGMISLIYFLQPGFIIGALFGSSFIGAAGILGLSGLSVALFSISNVLVTYNLGVNRLKMVYLPLFFVITEFISIEYFALTIHHVVMIVLLVNIALLIGCLFYTREHLFGNKSQYAGRSHA